MMSPCKDCEKRHSNCHAHCEDYQAYHRENEKRREENRRNGEARAFKNECRFKMMKKMNRRK